ncbi:hypothetical protein LIER_13935 [Lithospermum erythrorhizon]|uniref:Reverse transcriptase/retrotransposon-derived protein RNase H-like domain-containing protein n=1 Tax=Lithospermum erythrorhizon TaxID=34254 RepID=A0AAV3PZG2_LITER
MPGIDPAVAVHRLYVDLTFSPIKQKKRLFNDQKNIAIREEVQTLLKAQSIHEFKFPAWTTNVARGISKEKFSWDEDCSKAFEELKRYLGSPQLLSRPKMGERLQFHLAISDVAVSSVLIREVEGVRKLIYFVSHVLRDMEERYPIIDKAAFTLVISARKLKAYFESHAIQVVTDQPLKRVLYSPALSGLLTTWAVELCEFEISYVPRTSVRAQAMEDFVTECTAGPPPIIQGPRADDPNLAKPD